MVLPPNPCPQVPPVDELILKKTPVLIVVFDRKVWADLGYDKAYDEMISESVVEVGDKTWWVYSTQGYANIGQNMQDVKGLVKQKAAQTQYLVGCLGAVTEKVDAKQD